MRNNINLLDVFPKLNIKLNDKQAEIVEAVSKNRFVCIRGTRRGGKSMISSGILTGVMLNPGAATVVAAPLSKLTEIIWQNTTNNLINTLNLKHKQLNNKDKVLTFDWGAQMLATTLRNRSNVLGRSYDLFVIDEAAIYNPSAVEVIESPIQFLTSEIFPTLLEYQGTLMAVSTPRAKNWFYYYDEFCKTDGVSVKYTIYDVTHIKLDNIEKMKEYYYKLGMERFWLREFMCEYVELDGAVFNFSPKPTTAHFKDLDGEWFISIDPGLNFACLVGCITPEGLYLVDGFKSKSSTEEHANKIHSYLRQIEPAEMYCDPAAAQVIVDLAYNHDLSFRKAQKGIESNINIFNTIADKLFISTHNKDFYDLFIDEFVNYSYNPDTGKPIKKNDHLIDTALYMVASVKRDFPYLFEEMGVVGID